MGTTFSRRTFLQTAVAASASLTVTPLYSSSVLLGQQDDCRKKGFCCVIKDDHEWLRRIQLLKAHWFYSWGATKPDDTPEGVEFAPMIWGKPGQKTEEVLETIKAQGQTGEVKALMGFNEPDQHDQSNLTVEEALDAWSNLMEAGLPLTSPGCVHPDRQWMIDFMRGVEERNLRVDYVCVHSYGGPSAAALLDRLRRVYEMFERPLWITEFAVGDWEAKTVQQNRHSPEKIADFMREVLPMLDEAEFVDRYAWFSANQDYPALGNSALFDDEGDLTPLGELYREL
jgi:hypothetical protein